MPLPFPEFAEPLPTLLPKVDILPYEALPTLAEEAPIIGEFVEAAAEVGVAAAVAEPALILGAGLLAGAAAEAVFKKLNTPTPVPQLKKSAGGGRIGGSAWQVNVHYETTGAGPVDTAFNVPGNVLGLFLGGSALGSVLYYIFYQGGKELVLSDPPETIIVAPFITGLIPPAGQPGPNIPAQPIWVNPGVGLLPAPTIKNHTLPSGDTVPYTVQPLPGERNLPTALPNQPFAPGINVFLPEVGLFINFSPVNINIAYTTSTDTSTLLSVPVGAYQSLKPPKEPCPCPEEDTREILCRVKRLQTDLLSDGYDYSGHSGPSGQTGKITDITNGLFSVTINVGTIPSNERIQFFPDPSPNVYFFGWFSWVRDGNPGERLPLSFAANTFLAPVDATGYIYGLHRGCSATTSFVTRSKKPYVNNC